MVPWGKWGILSAATENWGLGMENAGRRGYGGRGKRPQTRLVHPRQRPKPWRLASLGNRKPAPSRVNPFVIGSLIHQWAHSRTFPPPLAPAFKQPYIRNCRWNSQPSLRKAETSASTPSLEPAWPRPPSQLLVGDWRRRLLVNGLSASGFGCDEEGASGLESSVRGFVRSLSLAGIRVSLWWQHPWPRVSFASGLGLELGLEEVRGPRDSGRGFPRADPPPPQILWWWTVRWLRDSGFDFEVSARP